MFTRFTHQEMDNMYREAADPRGEYSPKNRKKNLSIKEKPEVVILRTNTVAT